MKVSKWKLIWLFFALHICSIAKSQCVAVNGATTACEGEITTYFASLNTGCCPNSLCETGSFIWDVTGGTVVATRQLETTGEADIIWNAGGGSVTAGHTYFYPGTEYVYVTTIPYPDDPVSVGVSTSSLCPGNSVTLTAGIEPDPNRQFEWEYTLDGTNYSPLPGGNDITNIKTTSFPLSATNPNNFTVRFRVRTRSLLCYNNVSAYRNTGNVTAWQQTPNVNVTAYDQRCTNTSSAGVLVTVNNAVTTPYSSIIVNIGGVEQLPTLKSAAINKFYQRDKGTYSIDVYDSNADGSSRSPCATRITNVTIGQINPSLGVTVTSVAHETCYNPSSNTGAITVSATGATALPYTYTWDNGVIANSASVSGLKGDVTYTVVVKDANNCSGTTNQFVNEPDPLGISTSFVNPTCNGFSNGQISVTGSGGSGSFQYSVGGAFQAPGTFFGLSANAYNVTVRDAVDNTCITTSSVTLANPTALVATTHKVIEPICTGTPNGNVTINATGGTGSLKYTIQGYPQQDVGSATNGVAGGITYPVAIVDANGCSINTTVQVRSAVAASYSADPESCASKNDGKVTLNNVTGGTSSYTYSKDGTTFQASPVLTGFATSSSHVVKIRDGSLQINGTTPCEYTMSNVVVPLRPAISPNITQTATISCFNDATAALNLTPGTGWSTPYTFLWKKNTVSTGITTEDISSVGAGDYEVTITDAVGCSIAATRTITQPTQVSGSFSIPTTGGFAIACKGDATGSVNLTPSGGTPGYSFLWYKNDVSIGTTTEDIGSLTAGNYKVRITDANNCVVTTTNQTLTEPTNAVAVALNTKTDVNCFGQSTGAVNVSGTAGVGSLQYKLDGAIFSAGYQVSSSFISLPADNYTVTAKDANGCTRTSGSISILSPASAVSISGIAKANPICNGTATGSLTISPQGGTSPYTYRLDGSPTVITDPFIQNVASGDHVVQVVDSKNCTVNSATQTLTNPPAISFGVINISPQSCATVIDGGIATSASGGTGTLQFSINGTTFQSSATFTGLSANTYTITARDANSCTKTAGATVGTAPPVNGTVTQTAFINCFGQSTAALSIAGSGGTGPYNYLWSNSSTSSSISGLPAATYSVQVADNKGCTATKNLTVTQPAQLTAGLTPSSYNGFGVTCPASTNGFINLTVSGGTAGYSYSWNTGATIKDISGLAAGTYSVTVTDSKSCSTNSSITLTTPLAVAASVASQTGVSCNGGSNGSLQINATGGTGTYEFSKNNGTTWQSSNAFGSLAAGSITISVRDQNGCSSQTSTTVTQPSAISVNAINIQNTTCGQSNGGGEAVASGGTGAYAYRWINASALDVGTSNIVSGIPSGSYTITVTDQNSCTGTTTAIVNASNGAQFTVGSITATKCSTSIDGSAQVTITSGQGPYTITWSSGETGVQSVQLPSGTNTVSVLDGNSCTTVQSFSIPSPAPIAVSSQTLTPPTCPGTSSAGVDVQISGGTAPYSYAWNGVNGTSSLQNVTPGNYQLRVVDSKNCELNQSVVINDLGPILISVSSSSSPSCNASSDGIVTVQGQGGNGGFTFTWPDLSSGTQHAGLAAGDYLVTAKDSKNCTTSSIITLLAPPQISLNLNIDEPSCNGLSDGAISATGIGGTGTYLYSLNGGGSWTASPSFGGLSSQSYTIHIKDNNGCTTNSTIELTEPALLSVTPAVVHTTCGLSNGGASAVVTGGTGSYTYSWKDSFNQVVATATNLSNAAPDNYVLTVADQNLCSQTVPFTIDASPLSDFEVINLVSTSCLDSNDGQATVRITSGPGPYTYAWSSNESSGTATKLVSGTNTVSVRDGNNCLVEKTFQITPPAAIDLSTEIITQPTCPGSATASIQVVATGGAGGYGYSWNGVSGGNQIQNLTAGPYTLDVVDVKGCRYSKVISVPDVPIIVIDATIAKPTCFAGSDGSISVSASGGNGTFAYQWGNGISGAANQGLSAGNYTVVATDAKGCTKSSVFSVADPEKLVIDVGQNKVVCPGQTLIFDPGIAAASYVWSGPAGFKSATRVLSASAPGVYSLTIVDSKGCAAEDSFSLSISDKLLKADLIMVSEAHARDTIIVIDISWPLPDAIHWDFDDGSRIIESTKDYALIVYDEPGVYTVTLQAALAGCESAYSQNVTILKERQSEGGRVASGSFGFVSYSVHPNPFHDSFELNAELTDAAPLQVQLIHLGTNKTMLEEILSEDRTHRKAYSSANLVNGIYVLVVKSRDQVKSIRLLKL